MVIVVLSMAIAADDDYIHLPGKTCEDAPSCPDDRPCVMAPPHCNVGTWQGSGANLREETLKAWGIEKRFVVRFISLCTLLLPFFVCNKMFFQWRKKLR